MNALADDNVADFLNEHFTASYLKVGTFQIVRGAKVGGNVAAYVCLPDGSVLHAVAGKVDGAALLRELRWAHETRRAGLTVAAKLKTGTLDESRFRTFIKAAHYERYIDETKKASAKKGHRLPATATPLLPPGMPKGSNALRVHWLLAMRPLNEIDSIFPFVWEKILREKLSVLPVAAR